MSRKNLPCKLFTKPFLCKLLHSVKCSSSWNVQLCLHACACLSTEACIYARVRVSWRMGDSWRTESTPSLVQKAGRRKGGAAQLTALHAPLSVSQERWQWSRTRCPSLSGPKGRVAGVCLWCHWWVEMFQLTSCWSYFKKVCLFASLQMFSF